MTEVQLTPTEFSVVLYDAAQVRADAAAGFERAGVAVDALVVTVDEDKPTTRMRIVSLDPAELHLESGTLENTKKPRTYSSDAAAVTFTKLGYEFAQRLDDGFGAPALDAEIPLAERIAWDVQLIGRVIAAGVSLYQPKYRYDFRNRHGFTDAADAAFDRLIAWNDATWADISALSHSLTD